MDIRQVFAESRQFPYIILSRLLHASIEDILVVDGDIVMSALFETIEDAVSESGELAYVISLLKGFY